MSEKKLHYKMYKAGKHWVFAAITTVAFGSMMVNHASADQTTETTTPNVVATNDNKTTVATAQDAVENHADQAVTTETTETTEPKEASSEQTSASAKTATKEDENVTSTEQTPETTATDTQAKTSDTTASDATIPDTKAPEKTGLEQAQTETKTPQMTQVKVDGNWYLQDEQGNYVTGFQEIKDQQKTVYYDPTRKQMVYGQQKIDGNWYLFDTYNGAMQTGLQYLSDQQKLAYYNDKGQMQYGTVEIDGQKYQADTFDGAIKGQGQQKIAGNWYLFGNNNRVKDGWQWINDQQKTVYYDKKTAQMVHGEQKIAGHWYLFDENTGAMQRGFKKVKSGDKEKTVYYNQDGWMQYGQQKIANNWYNFDTFDGAMKTGLVSIPEQGKTVYYNNDGKMQYGWQWVNNATRYFDTFNGAMTTGQRLINGHWYLFDKTGAMQRGIQDLKDYGANKSAYYNQDGWMQYGWQWVNNGTHYFDTFDGAMAVGEKKIAGHWYLFDKTGAMQRGIQDLRPYGANKTAYYNQDGWMQYGWQWVNNGTHYFDTFDGAMAVGQKKITGHWYLFDQDGVMQRGFKYLPEDKKIAYYNKDGWMVYGKQNIAGRQYDFDTYNGALKLTGQQKLAGNWYLFNKDGQVMTGFQDLHPYGQNKIVYYDPKTAQMVYGYKNINGDWYLFDKETGSRKTGVQTVNGVDLAFDSQSGKLQTGLQTIKGNQYYVDKVSGNIRKNFMLLGADNNWIYFDKKTGIGTNALQAQYKQGTSQGNPEFVAKNAAYSYDTKSFETVDGFLTADTWYRPKEILANGSTWQASTENDLRPLLMTWWPNGQIKVDYLNFMKDKGFIYNSSDYKLDSDANYLDLAAQEVQRNIERKIAEQNSTEWLRSLMSDFVKSESIWNKDSESVKTTGNQQFQGGFLKYVNSDLTPEANSDWRKLGYQPLMLTNGVVGPEFLLANDIDNSNPVVQAEQLNWLHYLMNFGTITANDPDANFDGIRIDAVDNVDASLLSLAGDYLRAAYGIDQNDAKANQHISILEDWTNSDANYTDSIGNPELTMDNYTVQQLRFSLGLAPDQVDRMGRFLEWNLVDRSNDDTENKAIPNYAFVRAHDSSVQEQIQQAATDLTGAKAGEYTAEQLEIGLKAYTEDQKKTVKKYNRYNIPSSYAILLTNKDTIPRVYYGDLFTDEGQYMSNKSIYYDAIDNMLKTRMKYVSGGQTMSVDSHDIMTSVRFGKGAMKASDVGTAETRTQGMGLIVMNKPSIALADGEKVVLHMGAAHKNQAYRAVMLATEDGLANYTSDANAPIAYTDANGDLIFTNKDLVVNGKVQANTAIKGVFNPYVSGYVAMWVPVGASQTQDARTQPTTTKTTDGSAFHANAAFDSNLIYEGFSNFQAFPETPEQNANAVIAKNVDLFKSWGVTSFQLAPQYVSSHDGTFLDSIIDNGYAFTDRYDLAMSKNNKYGSHQDLINALKALRTGGIQVIADWVPDQIYNLPTKQVVAVQRVNEFGKKIDGTSIDGTLYVVNTIGGGEYQKQYGGAFLEELQAKYPELFKQKQPSTGVAIDPSEKITEWSAKYFNGTNILHRGSDYVLRDGNTYFQVGATDEVFLPEKLKGKVVKNGFWKTDDGHVQYYKDNGQVATNSFIKDGDNNWYYFDDKGNMVTTNLNQTITSDGVTADYFFLPNGLSIREGFVQDQNGNTYYYDNNGRKVLDKTFVVNEVEYTVDKTGKLVNEKALKNLDEIVTETKATLF